MIAVIVSAANNCEYCIEHHGEALNHFWKDKAKVKALSENYQEISLNEKDRSLCDYAFKLTKEPEKINETEDINRLKACGFDDRSILDAALVTAYFNFVNRMVMGLGVHLEEDGGKGYQYD